MPVMTEQRKLHLINYSKDQQYGIAFLLNRQQLLVSPTEGRM